MKNNRMKVALENIAHRGVPENTNLWLRIESRLNTRSSFMQTLRARPGMLIAIVVLALLLLTGVVYAVGSLMGYIPGVGFVDLSVPLRVLAEPVTVERGGIQVTVKQVVLSADATFISYQMAIEGDAEDCWASPRLQLGDGRVLDEFLGGIAGYPYEGDITFAPLPQDVNDAILLFDCTQENLEIRLHFVPAPLDMPIAPIIELATPSGPPQNALVLEKVIETENSYILFGRFYSVGFPEGVVAIGEGMDWGGTKTITYANGQRIPCGYPDGDISLTGEIDYFPWVCETKGKEHAWPLTITFNDIRAEVVNVQAEFNFDTGPNPQLELGQKWIVDQDIAIKGYSIHMDYIQRISTGYLVKFANDSDMISVGLEIVNAENPGSMFLGGSSSWEGNEGISYSLQYEGEVPSGKMTIRFNELTVNIQGKWQLQWQPDAVP